MYNSNAPRIEGEGSAYFPQFAPVRESCESNPFGTNDKGPTYDTMKRWLGSSMDNRMSDTALFTLGRELKHLPKADIKEALKKYFYGSDQHELIEGLIRCGIFQRSKHKILTESKPAPLREDTAEDLLNEAILYIPECMDDLRARIASYLQG